MCTSQKYDEGATAQNANESTVENQAPTVEIPAHLLTYADNWQITETLRLAQDPAVTDINRDLVLAAINAAFALGRSYQQQGMTPDPNRVHITLDPFQPHDGQADSEVDAVYWGLENRKAEALKEYGECLRDGDEDQADIALTNYEIAKQVQWQLNIDLHTIASRALTASYSSSAQARKGGSDND